MVTMRLSCTVIEIWRLKYWTHRPGHKKKDGRMDRKRERERGRRKRMKGKKGEGDWKKGKGKKGEKKKKEKNGK